jgi:predicted  nucleic acid-binding Zn-ribbon protein
MQKIILAVSLSFLFLIAINVSAEKTVKTIDLPFGFLASSTANVNYTRNITLSSPDGISKIISAEVLIRGDFLASTRINLWVNKKQCNPIQLVTPAVASYNYDFTFDCSSLTNNITSGNYTLTLNTNRTATNLYVNTRFTYYNNPKADLIMHGTEYKSDENGKLFLQLLDTSKLPIENSQCVASIYYPDGSIFVDSQTMTYLDEGIYYYNFNVPYMLGVYMSVATCRVPNPDAVINMSYDDFECGLTNCGTGWSTSWTLGSPDVVSPLASYNGTYGLRQSDSSGYALRNFTINTTAESIVLSFWARATGIGVSEYAYVWLCNTTKCILAKQLSQTDNGDFRDYTITIHSTTTNITDLKQIKINASSSFDIGDIVDFDNIQIEQRKLLNATEYQELKGSGEVHVTNGIESENCIAYSEFYNYSDYDFDGNLFEFVEGLAIYNITVESQSNSDNAPAYFYFETPYKYDCSSLEQFQKYNGTNWNDATNDITEYEKGSNEQSCKIKVETLLNKSQILYYRINMDNYQKWEIDWSMIQIYNIGNTINDFCMNMSDELDFNYTLPINRTNPSSNVTVLSLCIGIFDDIYWSESAFNESVNGETSQEGALTEIVMYRNELSSKATILWQLSQNFTGSSSASPSAIWNYASRTLTDYNHTEILQYLQDINYTLNNLNVSGGSVNITGILNYLAEINATTHAINSSMVTYYDNLYNVMLSINASIVNEINAINSTINTNIFAINGSIYSQINAINASIHSKMDTINDNIISTNTSLTNLINSVNITINSNINSVNSNLSNINASIMELLYSINRSQGNFTSLENLIISVNGSINGNIDSAKTSIENLINSVNATINSNILATNGTINANIFAINSTINGNIFAINQSLANQLYGITGKLQEIQDNITTVYNLVGASNATIMNKLYRIQDEITSVNDTVKSINQSIHSHLDSIDSTLNSIQGDLTQIKGNLTEVKATLQEINSTTYLISGKIDNLSLDLASINASVISYIGTSLNALESNLTTLIISVNDTVISSNATIMNKLYGIQGELANMTDTIVNNLLNITNITANITVSQQEVINTMVALYGNQAKNRNFAYLGVGITGLLTGGDSGAVQYCKDNMTLAQYSVQNVTGSMNMTNVFEDLTRCTYGCVKDACVIPQYMIWLYVLIALILVFVVYLWFERQSWSEE